MAKTYEQLKKEWQQVDHELGIALSELQDGIESRGLMDATMQRGATEVGKRIRA